MCLNENPLFRVGKLIQYKNLTIIVFTNVYKVLEKKIRDK